MKIGIISVLEEDRFTFCADSSDVIDRWAEFAETNFPLLCATSEAAIACAHLQKVYVLQRAQEEPVKSISFGVDIDSLAWLPNTSVIAVADRNGSIHIVRTDTMDVVHEFSIRGSRAAFGKYVQLMRFAVLPGTSEHEVRADLIIATYGKQLKFWSGITVSRTPDQSLHIVLRNDVRTVETADVHDEVLDMDVCHMPGADPLLVLAGSGSEAISVWQCGRHIGGIGGRSAAAGPPEAASVCCADGGRAIVVDGGGAVSLWTLPRLELETALDCTGTCAVYDAASNAVVVSTTSNELSTFMLPTGDFRGVFALPGSVQLMRGSGRVCCAVMLDGRAVALTLLQATSELDMQRAAVHALISDQPLDAVLQSLDQVASIDWVCRACLVARTTTADSARKLLEYAKARALDASVTPVLLTTVCSALQRLSTYALICRNAFEANDWLLFQQADMSATFGQLMSAGRIENAVLVWQRHSVHIPIDAVLAALDSVPVVACTSVALHRWLQVSLAPRLVAAQRAQYECWLLDRVRGVYAHEQRAAVALALLNTLPTGLPRGATFGAVAELWAGGCQTNPAVVALRGELVELEYLQRVHRCTLPLNGSALSSPRAVVAQLLSRADPVDLGRALVDDFAPYAARHALDESVLADFASGLLDRLTTDVMDADTHARVISLLDHIRSSDSRARIVVEALRHAPFPLSPELAQHAQASRQVADVAGALSLHAVHGVLAKYGFERAAIDSATGTRAALEYIALRAVRDTRAIQDAVDLVSTSLKLTAADAYAACLAEMMCAGEVSQATALLRSIPNDMAVRIASAEACTQLALADSCDDGDDRGQILLFALHLLREAKAAAVRDGCSLPQTAVPATEEQLEAAAALWQDWRVRATPMLLSSESYRLRLASEILSRSDFTTVHLLRLCQVIQLSVSQLRPLAIEQAASTGRLQRASEFCTELLLQSTLAEHATSTVSAAARALLASVLQSSQPVDGSTLAALSQIQALHQQVLRFSHISSLPAAVWLARVTELVAAVVQTTATSDNAVTVVQSALRPNGFREDSLVTDFGPIALLLLKVATSGSEVVPLNASLLDSNCAQLALQISVMGENTRLAAGNQSGDSIGHIVSRLAASALTCRKVDHCTAVGYVVAAHAGDFHTVTRHRAACSSSDYRALATIAAVELDAAVLLECPRAVQSARQLLTNLSWWQELSARDVQFSHQAFSEKSDSGDFRVVLQKLVQNAPENMAIALRFCGDYGLDADEARAAALVALLTQPPPPILDNSWRIRASAIAAEMQLDKLAQAAERALSAICPYDYDKISFACEQILHHAQRDGHLRGSTAGDVTNKLTDSENVARKFMNIIAALRNYTRSFRARLLGVQHFSTPTEPPTYWQDRFPVHAVADDALGTLLSELSPVTVTNLAAVIAAAGHDPDSLHVGIAERMLDGTAALVPRREIISTLRTVLSGIRNRRRATETALHVAESMPPGSERHQAFSLAVKLADQWVADSFRKHADDIAVADEVLKKAKQSELTAATEALLQEYDCEDLVKYSHDPADLLVRLYETRSVAAMTANSTWLHDLAAQIARRHSLDLLSLRRELVARWLRESSFAECQNAARVAYVMTAGDIPEPAERLLGRAVSTTKQLSHHERACALQAAFLISGSACSVSEGYAQPRITTDLVARLCHLLYAAEADAVGMHATVEQFQRDPIAVARALWRDRRDDARAVRLVCMMCVDGLVSDCKLFRDALQSAADMHLGTFLLSVLPSCTLLDLSHIWRSALHDAATGVPEPVGSLMQGTSERVIDVISAWPDLCDGAVQRLVDVLFATGQTKLCAHAALFVSDSNIQAAIVSRTLAAGQDATEILHLFHDVGGLTTDVQTVVFEYLSNACDLSLVANEKFGGAFVLFLEREGKMHTVLSAALAAERKEDVHNLIRLYNHLQGIVADTMEANVQAFASHCSDPVLVENLVQKGFV